MLEKARNRVTQCTDVPRTGLRIGKRVENRLRNRDVMFDDIFDYHCCD